MRRTCSLLTNGLSNLVYQPSKTAIGTITTRHIITMDGGFQFVDIILFAMIAVFLILRLRNTLGRRDGTDGNHVDPFSHRPRPEDPRKDGKDDNVVRLPGNDADPDARIEDEEGDVLSTEPQTPLEAGLTQIKLADPSFEPNGFLQGAKGAFEMILTAFAEGDVKTLKGLLSPDVFANFTDAIDDREEAGETVRDTLVGFKSVELIEADLEDDDAVVTVKFVSEQINVVENKDGEVIDGDPNQVITVTDLWTFRRNTRSGDPNWQLVATQVPA